jgi:hypothetical protein
MIMAFFEIPTKSMSNPLSRNQRDPTRDDTPQHVATVSLDIP